MSNVLLFVCFYRNYVQHDTDDFDYKQLRKATQNRLQIKEFKKSHKREIRKFRVRKFVLMINLLRLCLHTKWKHKYAPHKQQQPYRWFQRNTKHCVWKYLQDIVCRRHRFDKERWTCAQSHTHSRQHTFQSVQWQLSKSAAFSKEQRHWSTYQMRIIRISVEISKNAAQINSQ